MKNLENWKVSCLSALWSHIRLFSVDNINIAPQRPVKCFHNLAKKFDFNLIISNTMDSFNVKLGLILEI